MIFCSNCPNIYIHTLYRHFSFTWGCIFPVSILKNEENNIMILYYVIMLYYIILCSNFMISLDINNYFMFLLVKRTNIDINLTLSWGRFLLHRNQSIDMLSKSLDWFLYDRDLRHERVKEKYDYGKMESRINLLLLLEVKFHQQNTEILSAGTN